MLKSVIYENCKNLKIFSTEGMIDFVKSSPAKEFVIATETGIIHRLRKEMPDKDYYPLSENAVCEYMKMTTLEKIYNSLLNEVHEINVPEEIALRAYLPIKRMLEII